MKKVKKKCSLIILGSSVTALAVARNAYLNQIKSVIVDYNKGVAHGCSKTTNYVLKNKKKNTIIKAIRELGNYKENYFKRKLRNSILLILLFKKTSPNRSKRKQTAQ